MITVGANSGGKGDTLVVKDKGYDISVTCATLHEDAAQVARFLVDNLPGGTLDRVMEILLNSEIAHYQRMGDFDKSGKFIDVADIYRQRA
jgi:hypothetical protein